MSKWFINNLKFAAELHILEVSNASINVMLLGGGGGGRARGGDLAFF